jgi:FkbH-like protein
MWETEWARESGADRAATASPAQGLVASHPVAYVYLTVWSEHCVECTYPVCYTTCSLYARRPDGHCQRFRYGIRRDNRIPGLDGGSYEIDFKRWGKLETNLCYGPVTMKTLRVATRADRLLLKLLNPVSSALSKLSGTNALNRKYNRLREILLSAVTSRARLRTRDYDEFVVAAFNPLPEHVSVVVEAWQEDLVYRTSLQMAPGANLHRIDFNGMNLDLSRPLGRVALSISGDREARLIFSSLDFIKYRRRREVVPQGIVGPASKVKCVVWDLDNTLWDGTLVEDGIEGLRLRDEIVSVIKELDKRGILQSVASRNDHELACRALSHFGLQETFLCPQVHWGPKGESVRTIAEALNLGVDSLAFVDDSEVERSQVRASHPGVRVYSDGEARCLPALAEFDVPVTRESGVRRLRYLTETRRHEEARRFTAGHDDFLRTCDIQVVAFTPTTAEEIERCLELLQRTNQLNLSTHRYGREALLELLARDELICTAIRARDRFGDYGIVGIASVELGAAAKLCDFVVSCRIAKKRVENAWFQWLFNMIDARGYESVVADFIPTARNGVLLHTLEELGFTRVDADASHIVLRRAVREPVPLADIVTVESGRVRPAEKTARAVGEL